MPTNEELLEIVKKLTEELVKKQADKKGIRVII